MTISIRKKIVIVSVILTTACFISWFMSYQFIRINAQNLNEIRNTKLSNLLMAKDAQNSFENYLNTVVTAVSTKEVNLIEENKIKLDNIKDILIKLESVDSTYHLFSKIIPKLNSVHETSIIYVKNISNTYQIDKKFEIMLKGNNESIDQITKILSDIKNKSDTDFNLTVEKMSQDSNWFVIIGAASLALMLLFAIFSSLILLNSIFTRIKRLKNHFSKTDIDSLEPISETGEDELGDLLKASNTMILNIKESRLQLVEKEFVENIINTIKDIIIVCGNSFDIIRMNTEAKNFFSHRNMNVYGENIFKFLNESEKRKGLSVTEMKKTITTKGILVTDALLLDTDMEEFNIHLSAAAMNNSEFTNEKSFVFILRDINKDIAAEKEKSILETKLAQSAKLASLGTLGAGVAHELNNPLSAVIGYAEIIQDSQDLPEKIKGFGSTIMRASERMKIIIDELRKFSRDNPEREFQFMDIHSPIQGVLIFIQQRLHLIKIEIKLNLFKKTAFIFGDSNQIESIFLNFLTNSCDSFVDVKDDRKKQITITSIEKEGKISIIFQDNAMGIPENKLKNIFDPFFTTKPVGSGTGLGLFIVHQIIKSHNGTISVDSKEDKGTTFELTFPLIELKDEPKEKIKIDENKLEIINSPELIEEKKSVLIIDDELFILNLLEELLSQSFKITTVIDSTKVSDILRENTFDLIICDVKMPNIDGVALMKLIKDDMAVKTHMILMSGHAQSKQETDDLIKSGARFVLKKPFPNKKTLINIIQQSII
jgi:signal transduction histidine kinase